MVLDILCECGHGELKHVKPGVCCPDDATCPWNIPEGQGVCFGDDHACGCREWRETDNIALAR